MADHKKPSKEELEAEINNTINEIESDNQEEVEEPTQEPEEQEEEVQEEVEETPEEEPQEPQVQEEPQQTQEEIDYKKKFVESTREAQVLHAKNKQINTAIEEASLLPEPTEEELTKEYSDWDLMSDTEKRLAKESLISSRRFAIIHAESQKFKDIDAWAEKVDAFADDPKVLVDNPDLDGRIEEFKIFASKPTRRGIDFEDLVPAFLYSVEKARSKKAPTKGQMFEQGTGGNTKPKGKADKLSAEDGRKLMKSDYNKFKELLKAGKIQLPS